MPKMKQALLVPAAKEQHDHAAYEHKMTWRLRWFFAIIIATGYLASTCTGIIGFIITHNPYYLTFAATPVILLPALKYLVPMDERRYQIELRQIEVKAEAKRRKQEAKQKKTESP